jgi:hypothetical protein
MTTRTGTKLQGDTGKNSTKNVNEPGNGCQTPLDTEQEFYNNFDVVLDDLLKEKMKSYELDKKNKTLENILNELKEQNNKMAGKIRYTEVNKDAKSQRRQDIAHLLSKAGQALPDEYKRKCDAEIEEFKKALRAKYLSNKI